MKRSVFIVAVLVLFAVIGGYIFWARRVSKPQFMPSAPSPSQVATAGKELAFTGVITAVDAGCDAEGICMADAPLKAKIGSYWVTIDLGGDPNPEMAKQRGPKGKIFLADGKMTGSLHKDALGKSVEVYAKIDHTKGPNTLTLYGSQDYYIKFTPINSTGSVTTITGTISCLPWNKASGAQPEICALGLKTADGRYYGLNLLNQNDVISNKSAGGNVVTVIGTITSPDPTDNYLTRGTINATTITVQTYAPSE